MFSTRKPERWQASLVWQYSTGVPYTPRGRDSRETLPATVNSRRLPPTTTLDIQAQNRKPVDWRAWQRVLEPSLQKRDLVIQ